jgi:tripartite-type tricarboxylate transporter receptor subunit TctC
MTMMQRIRHLTLIGLATLGLAAFAAHAQTAPWPSKTIRIIVPFAAGSFTDTSARLIGAELTAQLGQTVIVENKGGAGSTLGTDQVAKAAGDGYTFLVTDNSFAVSSALYDKLPYVPSRDLMPVSLLADAPAVLAGRPGLAGKTLKDIVQLGRSTPDKMTFGSGGQGSSAHLAMEAFLMQNSVKMVHIPFKGIAAAIVDVAADRVDLAIGSVGSTSGYIKDGRILGLAVSGDTRHPMFPNVPTFAEAGYPNYKMAYWFGLLAPAATPAAIVDRMQQEIAKAVAAPKVREAFGGAGVRPMSTTSAAFTSLIKDETALWAEVIKRADIKQQ